MSLHITDVETAFLRELKPGKPESYSYGHSALIAHQLQRKGFVAVAPKGKGVVVTILDRGVQALDLANSQVAA